TRKTAIADRRAEVISELRRGFEYSPDDAPQTGDTARIVESLGYVLTEIRAQVIIAQSVESPQALDAAFAQTCHVTAIKACHVEAARFLATGATDTERRVAWQMLAGLEPGGGVPLRMAVAWDITDGAPKLIGIATTDGEPLPPRLVNNGGEVILHLPARTAGSGEGNADVLFLDRGGQWVNIGMTTWKDELPALLPTGMALWKGVEYGFHGLGSSFPVWREGDGNCCPTAGEAYASFKIVDNRLSIDTLDFRPGPAVLVRPLSCSILRAEYRAPWPSGFFMRFVKPKFAPNAQSDLVAILEQRDEDGAVIFLRHFAFAGSNGFGSASIMAVDGPGDDNGPPNLIDSETTETLYFHAFTGETNGLKYIADPPQSISPAPFGLFLPDLARAMWYDGIPDPKGGPPLRVEMPRDMWHGVCAE
uniref:hypothetical protein n=1 Tax=Blastomonas sp. TaxID=1909299 RepID=UPI0035941599